MELFLASSIQTTAPLLAKYLDPTKMRRLLFISTAAEGEPGDDKDWFHNDRQSLVDLGFEVSDFTVTGKGDAEIRSAFSEADVICVEGGNTQYLADKLSETVAGEVIKNEVKNGKPYIGSSAGSMIVGSDLAFSDSVEPSKNPTPGLGLLSISFNVHWGSPFLKDEIKETKKRLEPTYDLENKIVFLRDSDMLHVKDDWYRIESV